MVQAGNTSIFTIPAPVGGLNDKDPYMSMDTVYARELENFVCRERTVDIRDGYTRFMDLHGISSIGNPAPPATLATFYNSNGEKKLVTAAYSNTIKYFLYDITLGTAVDLTSGGVNFLTTPYFTWVNFNNKLIICSAKTGGYPLEWVGSGDVTKPTWTGPTVTELIGVYAFRNRLYFVENKSTSLWYGGVGATAGALTELDLSTVFHGGGYLMYLASTTQRLGTISDELFVAVSSQGEVLLYGGAYPGADEWSLLGRYNIGRPLGRKSFFYVGNELYFITANGVISMTDIQGQNLVNGKYVTLSDNIDKTINTDSVAFSLTNLGWGWEGTWYPPGRYLIVNATSEIFNDAYTVPSLTHQYVVNLQTRAWSKWTSLNAQAWGSFDGDLYFTTRDGGVQKMGGQIDALKVDTDPVINKAIVINARQAYTDCKNATAVKRFTTARPYVISNTRPLINMDVDVDFENKSLVSIASTGNGSATENIYKELHGLNGTGLYGGITLTSSMVNHNFAWAGTTLFYELGGVI